MASAERRSQLRKNFCALEEAMHVYQVGKAQARGAVGHHEADALRLSPLIGAGMGRCGDLQGSQHHCHVM